MKLGKRRMMEIPETSFFLIWIPFPKDTESGIPFLHPCLSFKKDFNLSLETLDCGSMQCNILVIIMMTL